MNNLEMGSENQSVEEPGQIYMNNRKYPVPKPPKTKQKRKRVRNASFINFKDKRLIKRMG